MIDFHLRGGIQRTQITYTGQDLCFHNDEFVGFVGFSVCQRHSGRVDLDQNDVGSGSHMSLIVKAIAKVVETAWSIELLQIENSETGC